MAEDNTQLTVDDIINRDTSITSGLQSEISDAKRDRGTLALVSLLQGKDIPDDIGGFDRIIDPLTEDLNELRRLRDEDLLRSDLSQARIDEDDEDILKSTQELLRLKEFERTIGDQLEASQLAQRTLFRESQSINRQQAAFEAGAQQSVASIQNRAAQTGLRSSSAIQGMVGSINTQRAIGLSDFSTQLGDISSDRQRLATDLTNDLEFLNETFDLGGDISAASQSIANRQARSLQRQQDQAEQAALLGNVGSLAGLAIGGPVGGAIGGTIGSVVSSIF